MIFIKHPFDSELKYLDFETASVDENVLRNAIGCYFGYTDFSLLYNGKKLCSAEVIPDNSTIHVTLSLPGGKGGFGSMLRAIGAQIEKTTNREACRDLSGRRLRDINEEQRLKKWIAKEAEREAEKKKRRQARIERLKSKPSHKFFDFEYEKEISTLPERIDDALSEGLQKAKQPAKRPNEAPGSSEPPKKKTWFSDEFSSSSSDSDSEANKEKDGSLSQKPSAVSSDNLSYDSSSEISDVSQPGPSSSKAYSSLDSEENSVTHSECAFTEDKGAGSSEMSDLSQSGSSSCKAHSNTDSEQNSATISKEKSIDTLLRDSSSDFEKVHIQCSNTKDVCMTKEDGVSTKEVNIVDENKTGCITNNEPQSSKDVTVAKESESKEIPVTKEPEIQDDHPINLLDYQNSSELEALGLDKLKMELMSHGLKCGGTLSDRAQRLWKIRGLQPHEYPSNLLAKKK